MLYYIFQLILSVLMLLCVITLVIAHGFYTQSIHGLGWLLAGIFLFLTGSLVKIAVNELKQNLNK